ncbi:hypothetical protein [Streptomyces sp. NBC_00620]|uniref:hypothetical protein n=1 Tax=Streptomyces sp. NBC_00620 TaxID=2903666 RepID=UPI00225952B8|nr:hypothetical protein [Streptomyces sp. NBC_00620]MCX4974229.1 hypothetical protein [Streptomyces sp. NBC_00620]
MLYAVSQLLHRITRRCPTHDRASYSKTRRLEESLGMPPSPPPTSFTDTYSDPDLIECGNTWCRTRR